MPIDHLIELRDRILKSWSRSSCCSWRYLLSNDIYTYVATPLLDARPKDQP